MPVYMITLGNLLMPVSDFMLCGGGVMYAGVCHYVRVCHSARVLSCYVGVCHYLCYGMPPFQAGSIMLLVSQTTDTLTGMLTQNVVP